MQVERLHVRNIRLYEAALLPCAPGLNILCGHNGAGKTTLLEALCIAAWGKAFESPDAALLRQGSSSYWVRLEARSDADVPYWVEVAYTPSEGKHIRSSHGSGLRPRDIIGVVPIVLLSPTMKAITLGAPHERRRFMDVVLSQSSRRYVELLLEHRRALRQRNHLLQHREAIADFELQWQSWTALYIRLSAELVWRRWQFVTEFQPLLQAYYRRIAPESLEVRYLPDSLGSEAPAQGVESIAASFHRRAAEIEAEELRRAQTLFGPHRDELLFLLNGMLARTTASQGQHKSILLSLKLAELDYLHSHRGETPLMLLDDVFAELDEQRSRQLLSVLLEQSVQTFITVTEPRRLPGLPEQRAHWIHVAGGVISPAADIPASEA